MSTNQYQGVDPVLSNVAIAYANDQYIAEQVFPTVPVKKQSGKHFVYDQGRFRLTETRRATGANAGEVKLTLTTGNAYYCEDHALKHFVADEDVENAETPTTPYQDATEYVTDLLMIDREKELADLLTSTANLTQNTTLAGTSQFNDYTNSTPFDVIQTGISTIHGAIGIDPNLMIVGRQVWDKLKHHPDLLERVKYSQTGMMTPDLLAGLLGIDRVLIAGASYNSANAGQSDSRSYIWGKHIVLAYVAPRVAPKIMTLGINYRWTGKNMQVKRLRGSDEEDREGSYVRVGGMYYDQNIVAAGAGYLIENAVA